MIDLLPWQRAPLDALIARGDKLPHALLVHGRDGIGKVEFARALAQSLLCEAPQEGVACGTCPACGWFTEGNHPDYREIHPEALDEEETGDEAPVDADSKDKKKSREIKISQIRAVADFMTLSTHRDGYRVLLIHPAESMNAAAANALLKTLEEPPPRSVIVLVTDQLGRLLATIRSRCQKVLLPAPDEATAVAWLTERGVKNPAAALAAAGGGPLSALTYADPEYQTARANFISALADPNLDFSLAAQNFEKHDLSDVLGWLHAWTFDLISSRMLGRVNFYREHANALERMVRHASLPNLFRYETELRQTRRLINHPLNARLLIEQLLIGYKQAIKPTQ